MGSLGYWFLVYPKEDQPLRDAHLDLLNGMYNEGILQVLHGSLHPVVEGCSSLGIFQVQLVDGLQQLLCSLGV